MISFKILWVISFVAYQAFLANADSAKSLVPALYVFGDSTVDAGNNNYLKTHAKANTFPYGIDFNNNSTGRFSNGKTFADIIAIKLGLPLPPPYLGISESERYKVAMGINYASASCGILNNTRDGECLSLDKQIEYFTSTVMNELPKNFRSKDEIRDHLSKSIYLLSIGSNDYILNYLNPTMGISKKKNPEEYADYLLEQLASNIKKMYDLGARKFVIAGIGPIGCAPFNIAMKPNSQYCNEDMNQKVKPFSDKLPKKLQELQSQLSSSSFIVLDNFNFFKEIRSAPEKFGFTNIFESCVIEGAKPCGNRKQYYFFDFAHTTEAANEIYANECFSGSKLCFPINIEKLVRVQWQSQASVDKGSTILLFSLNVISMLMIR